MVPNNGENLIEETEDQCVDPSLKQLTESREFVSSRLLSTMDNIGSHNSELGHGDFYFNG